MTHITYRLTCDCCNRREFSEGDKSEMAMFRSAQAHGWQCRVVTNGAMWDLCPECAKIKKEDLP